MNYTPNETARALVRKELQLAVVYPQGPQEFFQYTIDGIHRASLELKNSKCRINVHPYPSLETPDALREILVRLRDEKNDALVLTCSYGFDRYRKELEQIGKLDIPIFYNTMTGDKGIPSLTGTVQINNRAAGQMAAEFLGRILQGRSRKSKVALFVGNKHTHRERIVGFFSDKKKYNFELIDICETHEDPKLAYKQTGDLMAHVPDLGGIYVTSYNSVGVCDWFDNHPAQPRPVIIGQDLYPALNKKLRSGTLAATLFQDQAELGRKSVLFAFEYLAGLRKKEDCRQTYLPQLVLGCMADNFPYYDK
jgi:DNA-binding LacI/PurR family transcriptional regulator